MGREQPHPGSFVVDDSTPQLRYERELTVGSVGTLWLGRLAIGAEAGRTVLLRRIAKELFSPKDIDTLKKIAEAYSKVRHPSLVKLLGVVEQDGDLVSVSEHLDGVRLSDLVRNAIDKDAPFPATVAVRIVLDAARATAKAHCLAADQGLFPTERLFVPEGVFVAAFGGTLLTEVGLLAAIARCSQPRGFPDLLAQLAPEEIDRSPAAKGSTEVFSFGVLLWEMLANRNLFSRDSASITLSELKNRPIESLDSIERCGMPVPEALAEVVRIATSRQPTQRYATLEQFVTAVEQLPAHFIATEHQVAAALRELASDLLKAFHVDASESSLMLAFSEAPVSRLSTRPPPENGHNWEPPTFAQSKLVTSARALGRSISDEKPIESVPNTSAEKPKRVKESAQSHPSAVSVSSAIPEPIRRSRVPTALVLGALVFAAALASIGTWRFFNSQSQLRPEHEVVKSPSSTLQAVEAQHALPSVVVPEVQTGEMPEAAPRVDSATMNAAAAAAAPKLSGLNTGAASVASTLSTAAPAPKNSGAAFRPHNIAPYRPKGI